jgi:hypothetical protein
LRGDSGALQPIRRIFKHMLDEPQATSAKKR